MQFDMRVALLVGAGCIAGCAGNGEGLDENGRPIGAGGATPLTADLQSIQDHVFTPICAQCHTGAAAPLGFRLDQDASYAMLVNTPSSEVPSLRRVAPGDPDNSYIIEKLEGRAAVGGQMPLGQPPLPQATIDVIRQWIANGALASATAMQPDVMPMQVRAVTPAAGELLIPGRTEILLQAGGELDVSTVSASSVSLVRSGGDGSFAEGNEVSLQPVQVEVRSLTPTVLALSVASDAWVPDVYRLTISGHGATPAKDREGLPVSDFALQFSVGAPQ